MNLQILLARTTAVVLAGILLNIFLFRSSFQLNASKNGFTRRVAERQPSVLYNIEMKSRVYRIAGITDHTIYISNLHPGNYSLLDQEKLSETQDSVSGFNFNLFHTQYQMFIDSPKIVMALGNFKRIYFGNTDTKKFSDSNLTPFTFLRSCKTRNSALYFSGVDTASPQQKFFELTDNTKLKIFKETPFFDNGDAGFSNDGLLQFDFDNNHLVYCSYYMSHILILDTNFKMLNTIHTVDTFNTNFTRAGSQKSGDGKSVKYTNVSPRYVITSNMAIDNSAAFVQSRLKADNDSDETFENSIIIDVYDLKLNKYEYSLYIPKWGKEALYDYKVFHGKLYFLFEHHMIVYSLRT